MKLWLQDLAGLAALLLSAAACRCSYLPEHTISVGSSGPSLQLPGLFLAAPGD